MIFYTLKLEKYSLSLFDSFQIKLKFKSFLFYVQQLFKKLNTDNTRDCNS